MTAGARLAGIALAAVLAALLTFAADPAPAHVTERAGSFEVELGWGLEPPRLGTENFVEVNVADAGGKPVAVPADALSVEVVFGEAAVPCRWRRRGCRAASKPDSPRPAPAPTDSTSAAVCGESRSTPAPPARSRPSSASMPRVGLQFPVADPSAGELAQRLSSEAARVEDAGARADRAQTLAIVALALAAVALAVAARAVAPARERLS